MQTMALQVQEFIDHGGKGANKLENDTIASFVKLLGYSKNVEYRELLQSLLQVKNLDSGIKRHTKYALDKLW